MKAVGVPEEQAELQARQFELMRHEIESNLATKRDIADLATKRDVADLATKREVAELTANMAESEKEIIKYVGNQNLKMLGILGVLIALLKILPNFFN